MRQEQEIELVRKAKGGDTAAFAVMIRRYQNLVYATAFGPAFAPSNTGGSSPSRTNGEFRDASSAPAP